MSNFEEVAPDTAHSPVVTDHAFSPPKDRPWGLCTTCNLSRAAHAEGPDYVLPENYRCIDCVTKDVEVCTHERHR